MIKKIILVCIGIITTMSTMAQVTVNRGDYGSKQQSEISFSEDNGSTFVMKYGVKAGINLIIPEGEGFRVGGFLNMRWGQRTENSLPGTGLWGFQPEIMYSVQKVRLEDASYFHAKYIEIPLLLKVYPITAFSIEVGPEISYWLSTSPSEIMDDDSKVVKGDDCKGMHIGATAGFAYDFEIGLTVGARYTYRFTNVAKNIDWEWSNVQITVGWMF